MDFPNADGVRGNGSGYRLPSCTIDLLFVLNFRVDGEHGKTRLKRRLVDPSGFRVLRWLLRCGLCDLGRE